VVEGQLEAERAAHRRELRRRAAELEQVRGELAEAKADLQRLQQRVGMGDVAGAVRAAAGRSGSAKRAGGSR